MPLHKGCRESLTIVAFSLIRRGGGVFLQQIQHAAVRVMQFNFCGQALRHSLGLDKGKAIERWRRKITGLKGFWRPTAAGSLDDRSKSGCPHG